MSKKVIGMIVAAFILIAIVVAIVVVKVSDVDTSNSGVEINLEELNEELATMAPFNEMASMDIDSTLLADVFQIEEDLVKGFVGKFPMMNVHASMYLVVEATDGNADAVKEQVDAYAESYEAQWERYLEDQYELVKDRKCGVSGNYVYLFIGESAAEMEKLMK